MQSHWKILSKSESPDLYFKIIILATVWRKNWAKTSIEGDNCNNPDER